MASSRSPSQPGSLSRVRRRRSRHSLVTDSEDGPQSARAPQRAELPLIRGVRRILHALGFRRSLQAIQTTATMLVQESSDISTTIPVETSVGLPIRIPVQKSSDIYYRHLSAKRHGSPLWIPEPNNNLNISYRRRGIDIGDVGIITEDGAFDFLFNIGLPQDDPTNAGSVPEGFSPLNPPLIPAHDIQSYQELGEDTHLSSESITKDINDVGPAGITFIASAREGAILTMPEGAYTVNLANTDRFTQYLERNVVSWYRYANRIRGRQVKNGDLRLVIGVDKSRAWGMATFANATHETNRPLTLRFKPKEDRQVGRIYAWEYAGMADSARSGPGRREIAALRAGDESQAQQTHAFENQALFVRTLNATLQEDSWEQLESELGGSSIPTGTDIDAAPDIHSIRGNPKASDSSASAPSGSSPRPHGAHNGYNARSNSPHTSIAQISGTASALRIHPSTFINNFLLQSKPDAWIAITNDGDWISVLKLDDLSLPASDEILARITTAYEISDADGVAYLTPKDPLRRATVATTNIEDQFVQLIPTVQTGGEYSPASTSFNSNAFVDSSNSKTISRSTSFSSRNSNTTTLWSARSPSRSSNATSLWSRDEDSTPHNKGTSFFQNAKNVHISGGKFTQVQGNYAVFDQSRHTSNVNSFNTTNKRNIHNAYNNHSKEYGVLPPKTGPRLNRHHRQTGPQDAQALWEEEEEDDIFSTSQNSQSSGMPGDPGKHSPPGDPRYANNQYGQYGGGLDDSQHGAASSMRPPYMYTPASNRSNVQYTAGQVQNTSADLQQSFAAMMQPVKQQTVPDPEVEDMAALPFSRSSF